MAFLFICSASALALASIAKASASPCFVSKNVPFETNVHPLIIDHIQEITFKRMASASALASSTVF